MLAKDLKSIFPGKPKYFNPINIPYKRKINVNNVVNFIKTSAKPLEKMGLINTVIGLSGGIDSSVALILTRKALPKTIAVTINLNDEAQHETLKDSKEIAKKFHIKHEIINAENLWKQQLKIIKPKSTLNLIHSRSRFINNLIFQYADSINAKVIDTTDKSERILGRHSELFYGHIVPLVHIYKSELHDLGKLIQIPQKILIKKAGCPKLWDKDAFGISWENLDQVIYLMSEKRISANEISKRYNIDINWLRKVENRIKNQKYRLATSRL